jgi:hypothetical protein
VSSEHGAAARVAAPGPLEQALAALVAELVRREIATEVRRLVREELAAGSGAGQALLLSQRAAAQLAGVAPSTIRSWQADGLLSKGRRGRVDSAELRQLLATGGPAGSRAAPAAASELHQDELRQERARRAAREVLQGVRERRGRGGGA